MKKSDVNGDNTNEVYKWLKNEKAGLLGLSRIKVNLFCYTSLFSFLNFVIVVEL
jgi:glutathione peroxidase-family protein